MTPDEHDEAELQAIRFSFAYQRTINGCQFTYAPELRAKIKVWERMNQRHYAEAFNEAKNREAS